MYLLQLLKCLTEYGTSKCRLGEYIGFQNIVDFGANLFSGNWEEAGEAIASFIGFGKTTKGQRVIATGSRDEVFDCPLLYQGKDSG